MPPLNLDLSILKPKKLRGAAHLFHAYNGALELVMVELRNQLAQIAEECPKPIADRLAQAVNAANAKSDAAAEIAIEGLALIAGRPVSKPRRPDAA